jgi:hypothetical protein
MPPGVPADCLMARIRGRRSLLVRDWDRLLPARPPLATLTTAPWRQAPSGAEGWALRALQQEYHWAFSRMDEPLRSATAPFFWLAEVKTIAVSLRLMSGAGADVGQLLRHSLLADGIRELLHRTGGSAGVVAQLADLLAGYDQRFAGLADIHRDGGSGALEAELFDISLRILADMSLHSQMRCYVELVIDSRNLVTVAKRLRWKMDTIPPLLEGGTLPLPRLAEQFRRRDSAGLLYLAMGLGGQAPYAADADLDQVLYEAQQRILRRLAREADGIGMILDYLWRCGNEAANINLLEHLEAAGIEVDVTELRR